MSRCLYFSGSHFRPCSIMLIWCWLVLFCVPEVKAQSPCDKDDIAPTVFCKNGVVVRLGSPNYGVLFASALDNGSSDNCPGVLKFEIKRDGAPNSDYANQMTFHCGDLGAVVLRVTDNSGNQDSCKTSITLMDNIAPSVICKKGVVVHLGFPENGVLFASELDDGSSDNCPGVLKLEIKRYGAPDSDYADRMAFHCGDLGAVVLRATDVSGNKASCTTSITVIDNIAPTVVCKNGVVVRLGSPENGVLFASALDDGSSDNCPGLKFEIKRDGAPDSDYADRMMFHCDDLGVVDLILRITDNSGNQASCPTSITVIDNINPVALCKSHTLYLDRIGGMAILNPSDVDGGSNDNCGIGSLQIKRTDSAGSFTPYLSFDCFDVSAKGGISVTLKVVDTSGNSSECRTTVTVLYYDNNVPNPKVDVDPVSGEICSDETVTISLKSNNFEEATGWSWTTIVPSGITPDTGLDGIMASGNYTIVQQFANLTDAADMVTYTITPTLYGRCPFPEIKRTLWVNPHPKLLAIKDASICNNTSTNIYVGSNTVTSVHAKIYYRWEITDNPWVSGETNGGESEVNTFVVQPLNNGSVSFQEITYTLYPSLHLNNKVCPSPDDFTYKKETVVIIEPAPVIKVLTDQDTDAICNETTVIFTVDSVNHPAGKWQYTLTTNISSPDLDVNPNVSNTVGKQNQSFKQTFRNDGVRWQSMGYNFSPRIITKEGQTCHMRSSDVVETIRVNPTPLMTLENFRDSICHKDDGPEMRIISDNGDVFGTLRYNLWKIDDAGHAVVDDPSGEKDFVRMADFTGWEALIDQSTLWNQTNTMQTVTYYLYPVIEYRNALHCSGDSLEQKIYLAPELKFDWVASEYSGGRNVSCYNASDGSIAVQNVSGGWPGKNGYDYEWIIPVNPGNTPIITNRPAGSYSVTVSDKVIRCKNNQKITLTQPDLLEIKKPLDIVLASCSSSANGKITIHAKGGTRTNEFPYTYQLSFGEQTFLSEDSCFSDLKSGSYIITVTDVNNCFVTENSVLDYKPGTNIEIPTWNVPRQWGPDINNKYYNISCPGANDGLINPTNITPATIYTWKHDGAMFKTDTARLHGFDYFVSTPTRQDFLIDGLSPGCYELTIIDIYGCEIIESPRQCIDEPDPISNYIFNAPPSKNGYEVECDGTSTGTIEFDLSKARGGYNRSPYSYELSSPNEALSNLTSGTYYLTIYDRIGTTTTYCQTTDSVVLTEPPPLIITADTIDYHGYETSCYGDNSGSITLTVSGGDGSKYRYLWHSDDGSGFDATANEKNQYTTLSEGTYWIEVSYNNGACSTSSRKITLRSPPKMENDSTVSHVTCYSYSDASIRVNISGGVPGYSYRWSPPPDFTMNNPNDSNQFHLRPGTYELEITDVNKCIKRETYILTEPYQIIPNLEAEDMSCDPGNDGYIVAKPSGGTPGYAGYTFMWDNGSTADNISGLTVGTYILIVTDPIGCKGIDTAYIKEPLPLTVTATSPDNFNGYNIDCFGNHTGSIELDIQNGRASYTYQWSSGDVTDRIDNVTAGTYHVTVIDRFNCRGDTSITLTQPQLLWGQPVTKDITCPSGIDGEIQTLVGGGVSVSSDKPYRYEWKNGIAADTIPFAVNLRAGLYEVRIIDKNDCFINFKEIELKEPPAFSAVVTHTDAFCSETPDGEIRLKITGGTAPYKLQEITGATSFKIDQLKEEQEILIDELKAGAYSFEITDAMECKYQLQTFELGYSNVACLTIPNAFSPNDDGTNDRWEITVGDAGSFVRYPLSDIYEDAIVEVYSRWGILLYRSQKGYKEPWDGKYHGQYLPMDSYLYIIRLNKNAKPITGNVHIIR